MQEKSGLYQVEATDELSMILHVIGTAKEERIVFIVGEDGRTFHNLPNLRIITSYAQDRYREVAIVTDSPQLSALCLDAGVSCFSTLEEAKGKKRVLPKKRRNFRSLVWVVAGLLLAGGLYVYFAHNSAVLVITPATRPWQGELVVAVEPGALAGKGEQELTLTYSISPKGRKVVGVEPAKGTVSFFNNTTQSIKVPKGTAVVSTAGQRYLISQEITVPKQQKKYVMTVAVGVSAGQAQAPVMAANKGTGGNAQVGKLNRLEGPLADKLQVINTEPLRGGADQAIPVVTGDDLKLLEGTLKNEAKRKIQSGLPAQEKILLADSTKLQTLEFNPKGSVGQNLQELQGTLKVKAPGHYLSKAELTGLIVKQIGERGSWQPKKSNLSWQILEVKPSAGGYILRVNCQGTLVGKIQPGELAQNIAGKTKSQAESILGGLAEVDSFQLSSSRNKLPKWRRLIKVVFQGQ